MQRQSRSRSLRCHAERQYVSQKVPRLPDRVKQRIQELKVLAEWRGIQAEPKSATWVERSHRRDLDIKNGIRQNAYLRPTRALDGMPRDPDNLRYRNHKSTAQKVEYMCNVAALHNGELREVRGHWQHSSCALRGKSIP